MNHMQITAKLYVGCWKYGFKTCGVLLPPQNILFINIYLDITCWTQKIEFQMIPNVGERYSYPVPCPKKWMFCSNHSLLYAPPLRERDASTYWLEGWVDCSVGLGTDMKRDISCPPLWIETLLFNKWSVNIRTSYSSSLSPLEDLRKGINVIFESQNFIRCHCGII